MRTLVIIHGWSDNADSFRGLARQLAQPKPDGIGVKVTEIHLGDYISLDDQVTFADLVDALDRAWDDRELPRGPYSVDAIVHSTGALLIRDWIARSNDPSQVPIKRLLMLAPANFGSPIAHTGRSLIGRALKGWQGARLFETGAQLLKGLELASPYTWELASRDLFTDKQYYGPGRVLCTALVGNTGYSGIRSVANRPGSDGTVRVSTANMHAVRLTLDFTGDPAQTVSAVDSRERDDAAFAIVDGENHGSITEPRRGPDDQVRWDLIVGALSVDDNGFDAWRERLRKHTEAVTQVCEEQSGDNKHGYQNIVVRVVDHHKVPVTDYVIEFYVNEDRTEREKRLTRLLQEDVVKDVHVYSDDRSMRSMLIDCTRLFDVMSNPADLLKLSITAHPEVATGSVGYRTYTGRDIGSLSLDHDELRGLFQAHRTVLITLRLRRYQSDDLFRFKSV